MAQATYPGLAGHLNVPLYGVAPSGVYIAGKSPCRWWALTPPFHPCLPEDGDQMLRDVIPI